MDFLTDSYIWTLGVVVTLCCLKLESTFVRASHQLNLNLTDADLEKNLSYRVIPAQPDDFKDSQLPVVGLSEVQCAKQCLLKAPDCNAAMYYPMVKKCRFSNRTYPCNGSTALNGPTMFQMGFLMLHCFSYNQPKEDSKTTTKDTSSMSATNLPFTEKEHKISLLNRRRIRLQQAQTSSKGQAGAVVTFVRFPIGKGVRLEQQNETYLNEEIGKAKDSEFGNLERVKDEEGVKNETEYETDVINLETGFPHKDKPSSVLYLERMVHDILPDLRNALSRILHKHGYDSVFAKVLGPMFSLEGTPAVLTTFETPSNHTGRRRRKPIAEQETDGVTKGSKKRHYDKPQSVIQTDSSRPTKNSDEEELAASSTNVSSIVPSSTQMTPVTNPIYEVTAILDIGDYIGFNTLVDRRKDGEKHDHSTTARFAKNGKPGFRSSFRFFDDSRTSINNESEYRQDEFTTTDFQTTTTLTTRLDGKSLVTGAPESRSSEALGRRKLSDTTFSTLGLQQAIPDSTEAYGTIKGPPDPPRTQKLIEQVEGSRAECDESLLLPCSLGVGKGCRVKIRPDGCRECNCPLRSPARGCFGSIYMSEATRLDLLYGRTMCSSSNRPAQAVIRYYRRVSDNLNIDECTEVQHPYCDSTHDQMHRMPRTKAECEHFCYIADDVLTEQVDLFKQKQR